MKIKNITLCGLFAALTAVLSQFSLPIGPVPINLATFAVFCAGGILGSKLGAASLGIWAALGICGVPVFTMFRGGIGTLLGPTGGYIIGYIPAAWIIGFTLQKTGKKFTTYVLSMTLGAIIYFSLGTLWFMLSSSVSLSKALSVCVLPFIPGDLLKIFAASILCDRTNKIKQVV